MNDDIVAALERERLRGMPRWKSCPAWLDEAQRRLRAEDNSAVTTLLRFNETAADGAQTPYADGLTLISEGLSHAS